jgi:hypothetical protein
VNFVGFWRTTLKSLSRSNKRYSILKMGRNFPIMFSRTFSFTLTLVLACSGVAVCASPQASMNQRDESRDDQYQQEGQAQQQGPGQFPGVNPSQTQEGAPVSIPTVVLDEWPQAGRAESTPAANQAES